MSIRAKAVAATTVAGGMLIGSTMIAAPAHADISRSDEGMCRSGALYDLEVERDDGMLEIDFDVDRARPGEVYRATVKVNKKRVWRANLRTDSDGDVWFTRMVRDRKGPDRITVRLVSNNGDVCRAKVRV